MSLYLGQTNREISTVSEKYHQDQQLDTAEMPNIGEITSDNECVMF